MGGNVKVGAYVAQPFELDLCNINSTRFKILELMYTISRTFATFSSGKMLFGKHVNLDCFTGSSVHLLNSNLLDTQLLQYKPSFGDIDIQAHYSMKLQFEDFIKSCIKGLDDGSALGEFTCLAYSKHGNEISLLVRFPDNKIHQIDFQFVDSPGFPHEQFLHSAAWEDIVLGIKGAHHKILLNALGLDKWKFSIINGLQPREQDYQTTIKDPMRIQRTLFGDFSMASGIRCGSFVGLVDLVSKFTPRDKIIPIFVKFAEDARERVKDSDATHAAIMYYGDKFGIDAYA